MSLNLKAGDDGCLTRWKDMCWVSQCASTGLPMMSMRPIPAGSELPESVGFPETDSPTSFTASPSVLQWSAGSVVVAEATWQDVRTIRIRGTVPFAMHTDNVSDNGITYLWNVPAADAQALPTLGYATLNSPKEFRLVALKGSWSTVNANNGTHLNRRVVIAGDDQDPSWEMALVEMEFKDVQGAPSGLKEIHDHVRGTSFDECRDRTAHDFSEWARQVCGFTSQPTVAELGAAFVLWDCIVRADGMTLRDTVVMSKNWMNRVWSWDHCFNALSLAPVDFQLALDQLLVIFDYQTPEGKLPDIVGHMDVNYAFCKPPIYGWAIAKMLSINPDFPEADLRVLIDKLSNLMRFWLVSRKTSVSKLPYWQHGNDCGWDNATCFDKTACMIVADLPAWLASMADLLAVLSERIGEGHRSAYWTDLRDELVRDMLEELWDGKQFLVKDANTGESYPTTSLIKHLPLVIAKHLPEDVVASMLESLEKHTTEWGCASEQLDSALYQPDGYWRGPIWPPIQCILESALRNSGHTERADALADGFLRMCAAHGFAENYDALSGKGQRDVSFSWSASAFLIFAREAKLRELTA